MKRNYHEPTAEYLAELRAKAEQRHREELCKTWGVDSYEEACRLSQEMYQYLNQWARD